MSDSQGMDQNEGAQPPTPAPGTGDSPPSSLPAETGGTSGDEEVTWGTDSAPKEKKKGPSPWLWAILILFLLLVVVGLVLIGIYRSDVADVPDLEGLTISEAVAELKDAKLDLGNVDYSAEVPSGTLEGTVIAQSPDAGEQVKQYSKVDLVVAGKAEVEVPDVVGLALAEATETLEQVGLKVKSREVEDAEAEEGAVVEQAPEAGAVVEPGSSVTLLVAAARPKEAEIPDVVGMSQDDATAALEDMGFLVQAKGTYDEKVPKDSVISQDPEAGAVAEPGAKVTLMVSLGPNPEVMVPDVVGKTEADAAKALTSAGFEAVPSWAYSGTVEPGLVISQNPAGGTTTLRGSPVGFLMSLGPEPPTTAVVPDVIGKAEAEANDILKQAGYEVVTVKEYSDVVPEGLVGLQVPLGGSVTEPGITVAIIVSEGPRPPEFVIVPDVREMTLEEATQVLEEAGLQVLSGEVFTTLAPEGQVFAQIPAPESSVAPDSYVLVILSKGPPPEVSPF